MVIDVYDIFYVYIIAVFFYHLHNICKGQSQGSTTCKWQSHCNTFTFDIILAYLCFDPVERSTAPHAVDTVGND